MKRIAIATLAALTFAAPLAPTIAAADPPRHSRGWDRHDRDHHRSDRRDDRRAYRDGYRDGRHADNRWDHRRYNGYNYRGQWHYGPPPQAYYGQYQPGYRAWRRGDRLPAYYRQHYRAVDYHRYGLRPPPRGYHYVRDDDRGEYLLVGIATGVILGIIASQ